MKLFVFHRIAGKSGRNTCKMRKPNPTPLVFRVVMQPGSVRKYDASVLSARLPAQYLWRKEMDTIRGTDAVAMAESVSRMGGDFLISFFPFSRQKKPEGKVALKTFGHCTCRKPLPHDKFDIDGKNFFLFLNENDEPKACYRVLIRYMAFSKDGYKLKRVIWYE